MQDKPGEVLTSEEIAARLKVEEEERKAKKCKKNRSKSKPELTKEIKNQIKLPFHAYVQVQYLQEIRC